MLNQFIFIGRMAKNPQLITTQNGSSLTRFTLAVRRPYRNSSGSYDTDFVQIVSWNKLAERVADYCGTGSLVSVKGRVQMRQLLVGEDKQISVPDVVADQVTFLKLNKVGDGGDFTEEELEGGHPTAEDFPADQEYPA
ncbi:single-stranded DNA-binding protein [Alkalicoccus saliphilus]|jgi:single-strand DNA-binding protein|uniref:Single-stranded DNA-binding protein n=1 Tax=Alkalicoccus saliphilus TaxID=200989 RepID=A0A2T4U7R3_9BACI|nr:single-stranded DNA-binding protein [Alkalicoccus saliphilus]PTL39441.1 single-stranded DNA-binding protein [Alkalicoccus saliphilus]